MLQAIALPIASLPQKYNEWLNTLNSTNFRIQWTMVVTLGTAIRYWASNTWVPGYEWLAFLAVMAGIDSWQFGKKRDTHQSPPADPLPPKSTP